MTRTLEDINERAAITDSHTSALQQDFHRAIAQVREEQEVRAESLQAQYNSLALQLQQISLDVRRGQAKASEESQSLTAAIDNIHTTLENTHRIAHHASSSSSSTKDQLSAIEERVGVCLNAWEGVPSLIQESIHRGCSDYLTQHPPPPPPIPSPLGLPNPDIQKLQQDFQKFSADTTITCVDLRARLDTLQHRVASDQEETRTGLRIHADSIKKLNEHPPATFPHADWTTLRNDLTSQKKDMAKIIARLDELGEPKLDDVLKNSTIG